MDNATDIWMMPPADTTYQIEGRGTMTLAQMLDGLAPGLLPASQEAFEELLAALGAWESVDEMDAALRTCEGPRDDLRL